MQNQDESSTVDLQREQIADTFGRETDPLAAYSEEFKKIDIDPFELFFEEIIIPDGLAQETKQDYKTLFRQWKDYMCTTDRHPTCPHDQHVKEFARYYLDQVGNRPDTVQKKINRLNKAYEYWQNDPAFPHPTDYNPFRLGLMKLSLDAEEVKEPHRISLSELREVLTGVAHIRDCLILALQLKLGLRAGEESNIQLQDIAIGNAELAQCYPNLGSHEMIKQKRNVIYIPPSSTSNLPIEGRKGNKSFRPRILPIDSEIHRLLLRYLLIRPETGSEWLFLSKQDHTKLGNQGINDLWLDVFRPEYNETEQHRGITSHFGRHKFTTYWRVDQDVNREKIKYMRGDIIGGESFNSRDAIDEYIHTYYTDVETLYRKHIFRLNI